MKRKRANNLMYQCQVCRNVMDFGHFQRFGNRAVCSTCVELIRAIYVEVKREESVRRRIFTIKRFAERHDGFLTESMIRWQIHKKDPEFMKCIFKMGYRVLIDEDKFFEYHERKNDNEK